MPVVCERSLFVILCFYPSGTTVDIEQLAEWVRYIVSPMSIGLKLQGLEYRLSVLEKFVKEVGHDIASSVQATISNLSNIAKGYYPMIR